MLSSFYLSLGLMFLSAAKVATAQADSSSQFCIVQPATPAQQEERWNGFVDKLFVQKKVSEAYHQYVVQDLVEHDSFVANGAQASIDDLNMILPGSTLVIYHKIFQSINSTGWIHTKASGGSSFGAQTALVDLYRFNGTCIVEHWPIYEKRPSNYTNPNALF